LRTFLVRPSVLTSFAFGTEAVTTDDHLRRVGWLLVSHGLWFPSAGLNQQTFGLLS
jgi:hypothetical protein